MGSQETVNIYTQISCSYPLYRVLTFVSNNCVSPSTTAYALYLGKTQTLSTNMLALHTQLGRTDYRKVDSVTRVNLDKG